MALAMLESDLAPGDRANCSAFEWHGFDVAPVPSETDPRFEKAYLRLWNEFGPRGELEQREVLADRLKWDASRAEAGFSYRYELISVFKGGAFAAARDHTAIVIHGPQPEAVVHLSHVLIDPLHRGSGMAGWLRAWPVQTARAALKAAGFSASCPITLVAEMEPFDPRLLDRVVRLKSYGRAGFRAVDPSAIEYLQPDFRPFEQIDASGGAQPLPLSLIIRRVGREHETELAGAELRRIVSALYQMYGKGFRPQDMTGVWEHLRKRFPSDSERVSLVSPTGEETSR